MKRAILTQMASLALFLLLVHTGTADDTLQQSKLDRWLEVYTWLLDQDEHSAADKLATELAAAYPDELIVRLIVENSRLRRAARAIAVESKTSKRILQVDWEDPELDMGWDPEWDWVQPVLESESSLPSGMVAEEVRIHEELSKPINVHFDEAKLEVVLRHIAVERGINMVLDEAGMKETGVTPDTLVTMNVDGIHLKSALKLLLLPNALDFKVEDEVIKISSKQRVEGELTTRMYDVADRVVRRQVSDTVSIPPRETDAEPIEEPGEPEFESLIDLITTTIDPDGWSAVGGTGQIEEDRDSLSLVVNQTDRVHREIEDLLEQLGELERVRLNLSVEVVRISREDFLRLSAARPLEWYGNRTHMNAASYAELRDLMCRLPGSTTLCAGDVDMHSEQRCLLKRIDDGDHADTFGAIDVQFFVDPSISAGHSVRFRVSKPNGELVSEFEVFSGTTCLINASRPAPILDEFCFGRGHWLRFAPVQEHAPESGDGVVWDDTPDGVTLVLLTPTVCVDVNEEQLDPLAPIAP